MLSYLTITICCGPWSSRRSSWFALTELYRRDSQFWTSNLNLHNDLFQIHTKIHILRILLILISFESFLTLQLSTNLNVRSDFTLIKLFNGVGPSADSELSEPEWDFCFLLSPGSPGFLTLGDPGLGLNTSSSSSGADVVLGIPIPDPTKMRDFRNKQ